MSKKIVLDDKYVLGGGMGCWAESFERRVNRGDVRMIGGILMKVQYLFKRGFLGLAKMQVCWTPVDDDINNSYNLRLFLSCSNHDYPMIGFKTNSELCEKGGPKNPDQEGY